MKKIAILNFHYSSNNYGAVIQAAALAHIIKSAGFDSVEHIDFVPEPDAPPPPLTFIQRIKRLISKDFFSILKNKKAARSEVIGNAQTFEEFRKHWIKRSTKRYQNFEDLQSIKDTYTDVIVGSDQVWRTKYTGKFALVYFLSFLPAKVKRISYAASFGLGNWEEDVDSQLSQKIQKEVQLFDAISVRESAGVNICQDVFNVKATHVLDPTLLVNASFYDEIIAHAGNVKKSDIVYYKLDTNEQFFQTIDDICTQRNYEAENIYHKVEQGKKSFTDVPEWIAKIKESQLVITDSFHCVCFSIIFKKQFICIVNKDRGLARLESLLSKLGLLDRLCFDFGPESVLSMDEISYDDIDSKLDELRIASNDFLLSAINNGKQ